MVLLRQRIGGKSELQAPAILYNLSGRHERLEGLPAHLRHLRTHPFRAHKLELHKDVLAGITTELLDPVSWGARHDHIDLPFGIAQDTGVGRRKDRLQELLTDWHELSDLSVYAGWNTSDGGNQPTLGLHLTLRYDWDRFVHRMA